LFLFAYLLFSGYFFISKSVYVFMKIAIVTSNASELPVSKRLSEELENQIKPVSISVEVFPSVLELISGLHSFMHFDLVIVLLYYGAESHDVRMLMEKIVEERSAGMKLVSFVEQNDDAIGSDDEALRITDLILKRLFGEGRKKSDGTGEKGSYTTL